MAPKAQLEPSLRVRLTGELRQKVVASADDSMRSETAEARYLIQLGLLADKNGWRIKNGQMARQLNMSR